MTTLNISLSEQLRAFIEEQTQTGEYSTASEYIRALIREDQKRRARERLDALLIEGLESGDPESVTPETWIQIRQEVRNRISERDAREA
jgi:antitoxin ParD1/3/4